jgi:hypothetical protein
MKISKELNTIINKIIFETDLNYLFSEVIQLEEKAIEELKNGLTTIHAIRCKLNRAFQFKNYWFFVNFSFEKSDILINLNFKGFLNLSFLYNPVEKTILYKNEYISLEDLIQVINKLHKDNQLNLFDTIIMSKVENDKNLFKIYQSYDNPNIEILLDFIKLIDVSKY